VPTGFPQDAVAKADQSPVAAGGLQRNRRFRHHFRASAINRGEPLTGGMPMPTHPSPSGHDCRIDRKKRRVIARGKSCPSNPALVRTSKKPAAKLAAHAVSILWLVTTPRPEEFSLKSFQWELIAKLKREDVAEELTRIGLLERAHGPAGTTTTSWIHGYRLAPVERPLDLMHSTLIRRITDFMLKYWECDHVRELRAVPGLMLKLLGGIRRAGLRDEYVSRSRVQARTRSRR
jgi:hypothetical protein